MGELPRPPRCVFVGMTVFTAKRALDSRCGENDRGEGLNDNGKALLCDGGYAGVTVERVGASIGCQTSAGRLILFLC